MAVDREKVAPYWHYPLMRFFRDLLDFGGSVPNALNSASSAGSESGDLNCKGKSKIILKVEYSANNVTAPLWIALKDSNSDVGRVYSTKVTPANTGENDDIQETNYFHGEGITLYTNGATSYLVVLADTPTNSGSISVWGKAI